ncbi:hypothetical protein HGM15179_017382 [Zosterops borbonicus]|uniref:Schwannomin interacting protein 1 C-terminal domain-containing protein n=1 Tax=Zosterops borbonicus TaxID=364589 RepID=A0A8K1G115_9PASS|nr:hypothetical protein HGM15179_017382 [Zosterops borbonicus]
MRMRMRMELDDGMGDIIRKADHQDDGMGDIIGQAAPPSPGEGSYKKAQKNERESIRQKLALGSFFDDGPGLYTSCSKSGKPSLSSRLQSGMNLQICFVNDSSSDKDSDGDDSKTETSLDTPLSPMSKQSSSYSDRDTTEEDSESLDDMDFLSRQKKLQAEAKMALAMAKPMAKMQVEVEKQNRKKSPVADLLPHMPHISECLMKRSLKPTDLRDMTIGQLQVIVNDLHSQIESLNEELVQLLLIRDELHTEQDAMLVDIEDLTSRILGLKIPKFHPGCWDGIIPVIRVKVGGSRRSLEVSKERDILRFNCTFEEVDVEDITENQMNTISACTAQDPGVKHTEIRDKITILPPSFGKCLQGISEDLRSYRPHLRSLEDPQLLLALDELMEVRIPAPNSSKIQ